MEYILYLLLLMVAGGSLMEFIEGLQDYGLIWFLQCEEGSYVNFRMPNIISFLMMIGFWYVAINIATDYFTS